jgi:hypothetical protein
MIGQDKKHQFAVLLLIEYCSSFKPLPVAGVSLIQELDSMQLPQLIEIVPLILSQLSSELYVYSINIRYETETRRTLLMKKLVKNLISSYCFASLSNTIEKPIVNIKDILKQLFELYRVIFV